jgi:hypothetical protein
MHHLPRKGTWGWCSSEGWSGGGASAENRWWTVGSSGAGGRMVLRRDEGGVEALRQCRFTEEKEMCGGALSSCYVDAERGEGRKWVPRCAAAWRRKGAGGDEHAVGDGRSTSAAAAGHTTWAVRTGDRARGVRLVAVWVSWRGPAATGLARNKQWCFAIIQKYSNGSK